MQPADPVARRMAEIANIVLPGGEPYVGASAFSHKGGMHVDGVKKNPQTFEHIEPESVGNSRRFLLSEISGRAAVLDIIRRIRPDIDKDAPEVGQVLHKLKEMEHQGYHFEGAEASQELLVCKELGLYKPFFNLEKLRISSEQPRTGEFSAYTYIKILVDGVEEVTAAEGEGPVNAMDRALKKAMEVFYPGADPGPADRLQSPRAQCRSDGFAGPDPDRVDRRPHHLEHGRRIDRHPGSILAGPGRLAGIQADAQTTRLGGITNGHDNDPENSGGTRRPA